ncbi:Hypothetical Protein FCC1311_002532 [Hondaea fermentalgiana]|uniref:Uncharacterized protein n=1 Tax=Hondaea fermentalgiana TaxID=2315210 RepID=A0A2R5G0I6_9STRA|nr:Hypothetical Protein FCC1311_002532 [Hondaea fermentalgiana]|eukprot:GBG24035.1 Hypothetical Protein FCC1311_002532 [Hondaea fermentalgiana]
MKAVWAGVLLALSVATVSARTSLKVPDVNLRLLKRHLQGSTTSELTPEQLIALYESSFVGRCLAAYGLNDYIVCELERIPENYTDVSAMASSDLNLPDSPPDMGATQMANITAHYTADSMTVDSCTEVFVGHEALQCIFYLNAEILQNFAAGIASNFSGVDACNDLVAIMKVATDPESSEEDVTAACTTQSLEDSSNANTRRVLEEIKEVNEGNALDEYSEDSGELSTADDSAGLVESNEAPDELEQFFAIADKCDEVAPNTVTRPPSSASLALPSLISLVAALLLAVSVQ